MQTIAIGAGDLDRYFQQRAERDEFSGVALITHGDAQLFAGAYGYASRAWHMPDSLASRFDTASVTKLFTAVAVLQLVERGSLAFETPVVETLGLRGTAIAPTVTVAHLLTHTSGIADDAEEESGEDYADVWKTGPNYAMTETADFLPQFAYKPANFPPGQGCRYCNCGYVLLGLLIEQASGLSYRDYVRQHIFGPAGMRHSDFFRLDEVSDDVAEGCDPVRAFFTPQVQHRVTEEWTEMFGYGLQFGVDESGNVLFAEKEGINAGVSAVIRHYPAYDLNVVLLSNTRLGAWEPRRAIHRMLLAANPS